MLSYLNAIQTKLIHRESDSTLSTRQTGRGLWQFLMHARASGLSIAITLPPIITSAKSASAFNRTTSIPATGNRSGSCRIGSVHSNRGKATSTGRLPKAALTLYSECATTYEWAIHICKNHPQMPPAQPDSGPDVPITGPPVEPV